MGAVGSLNQHVTNEVVRQVKLDHLSPNLRRRYEDLFSRYPDVFSLDPNEVGHCHALPQRIILKDEKKITSVPPYRTAPHLQPVVKAYVDKLLQSKVIQHSTLTALKRK